MILSLIVILLVGLVAYFHYIQGFFSAGLSAVLAAVSALIAFGYYETLVLTLLKGAAPDNSIAIALVGLFAVSYVIFRLVFDKLIPGNLRFPLAVDKAGAGVMGLVAGLIAVGLLAVAAQTLPFGPSIAGYERYPVTYELGVPILIPNKSNLTDAVFDELNGEKFARDESSKLLLPVDDLMLGFVSLVSGPNGSVGAGKPFASVHPNYLQELFGQRVGVQMGSRRSAWSDESQPNVTVQGLFYTTSSLPQEDPERWEVGEKEKHAIGVRHPRRSTPLDASIANLPKTHAPLDGNVLLVVRTSFTKEIADEKSALVSFSPSGVRVVAPTPNGDAPARNYFPIGVLAGGAILQRQHLDDFIFVSPDKWVDLVFEIDEQGFFAGGERGSNRRVAPDVFFEFKRLARIDLGGKDAITPIAPPEPEQVEVVRKEGAPSAGTVAIGAGKGGPVAVEGAPRISDKIFQRINVATPLPSEKAGMQTWGTFSMQDRRFQKLQVEPTEPVGRLATGENDNMAELLWVPEGKKPVQLNTIPQGENRWAWADSLPELTLVDASGNRHKAHGVLAKATDSQGREVVLIRYDSERPQGSLAAPSDARLKDVILVYLVPDGTQLKSFDYRGSPIAPINLKVQ